MNQGTKPSAPAVKVHVRFFAMLRERLHASEADVSLPEGATIEQLWAILCEQHPQLAELTPSISFAVNREYVGKDRRLSAGDEVALIPPVSGG